MLIMLMAGVVKLLLATLVPVVRVPLKSVVVDTGPQCWRDGLVEQPVVLLLANEEASWDGSRAGRRWGRVKVGGEREHWKRGRPGWGWRLWQNLLHNQMPPPEPQSPKWASLSHYPFNSKHRFEKTHLYIIPTNLYIMFSWFFQGGEIVISFSAYKIKFTSRICKDSCLFPEFNQTILYASKFEGRLCKFPPIFACPFLATFSTCLS